MLLKKDASTIADLFYLMDKVSRNDLQNGIIADERDYVSRLVTHFNYPFGIFNTYLFCGLKFHSKWFAKVNSSRQEKKFGCDSMIIFRVNDQLKVGLFEAKWPRVINDPKYQWDYAQKSTKTSHFTDQINRQAKWTNNTAIWEMFFYEEKVGIHTPPFDKYASTCIRHEFAEKLVKYTPSLLKIWNNSDLIDLIKSEQSSIPSHPKETNLQTIILDILTCSYGKILKINPTDRFFDLKSNDGSESVRCPVLSSVSDNERDKIIEDFMSEHGLTTFLQVNISPTNDERQ